MASAVTVFPLISIYSSISWNTGISFVFSCMASCPSTTLLSVQYAVKIWRAECGLPFSAVLRMAFPLTATTLPVSYLLSFIIPVIISTIFPASTIFKIRLNAGLDGIFVIPNLFSRNSFLFSA